MPTISSARKRLVSLTFCHCHAADAAIDSEEKKAGFCNKQQRPARGFQSTKTHQEPRSGETRAEREIHVKQQQVR